MNPIEANLLLSDSFFCKLKYLIYNISHVALFSF